MSNSVQMKLKYTNTTFERQMTISEIADDDLPQIKSKILAINASLAGGTDGGLSDFFVADDYDASDPEFIIGKFNNISEAKIISINEREIPLR